MLSRRICCLNILSDLYNSIQVPLVCRLTQVDLCIGRKMIVVAVVSTDVFILHIILPIYLEKSFINL